MSTMFRQWAKKTGLSVTFAVAFAMPMVAHAQEPKKDCEPGSWFCGETQQSGKDLAPLPPADAKPAEAAKPAEKASPPSSTQPVVVVQAREAPPAYYYVPKQPPTKREWGLNLHAGGAMMGGDSAKNAGMGLVGLGVRYRPIPHAAFVTDLDFAGGRDYQGFKRNETALTLNAMVFVNPKSVVQVYFVGGFGWAWAHATDDREVGRDFAYFGIQTGAGLEFRLSKFIALNVDLRGIIRGRVDDNRYSRPEFVSADGKATNTSGAGLLTAGLTFYW